MDILWAGHIEWKNFSTDGKVFVSHILHNSTVRVCHNGHIMTGDAAE